MSLIKPRTRGKHIVRHRTRLDHETHETLHAYAQFLGESPEYVLNQVIDAVLAKDKDFVQWRTAHPQSFVPPRLVRRMRAATALRAGSPTAPALATPGTSLLAS